MDSIPVDLGPYRYLVYIDANQRVEPRAGVRGANCGRLPFVGRAECSTRIAEAQSSKTPTDVQPHRDDLSANKIR